MNFTEWRKRAGLTAAEAGRCLGVADGTVLQAESRGRINPTWEAFARVVGGLPALTIDGEEFGDYAEDTGEFIPRPVVRIGDDPHIYTDPGDIIANDGRRVADVVALWALQPHRSDADYQMARLFLRRFPDGPQLR